MWMAPISVNSLITPVLAGAQEHDRQHARFLEYGTSGSSAGSQTRVPLSRSRTVPTRPRVLRRSLAGCGLAPFTLEAVLGPRCSSDGPHDLSIGSYLKSPFGMALRMTCPPKVNST